MLGIIGASFTAENIMKGLYEGSIGRVTEWLATRDTPEDAYAVRTAQEYGTFMHTTPWYEFPFGAKLAGLWSQTPAWGPHILRKWERRFFLTAEYGSKAVYGWLIGAATGAAYAPEDLRIHAWIEDAAARRVRRRPCPIDSPRRPDRAHRHDAALRGVHPDGARAARAGVRFLNIAGNDEILVTAIGPAGAPRILRRHASRPARRSRPTRRASGSRCAFRWHLFTT